MINNQRYWSKVGFILCLLMLIGTVSSLPLAGVVSQAPTLAQSAADLKAVLVVTGANHTCALTDNGSVKCWGLNDAGQLGDGTILNRIFAVQVQGLESGVRTIAAGAKHTCALLGNGTVKCWGANDLAQLGNSSVSDYSTIPVLVSSLTNVSYLAAGGQHSCIITNIGSARCWGSNKSGELGNGSNGSTSSTPVKVDGLKGTPSALSLGDRHTCAVVPTGIQCWGDNGFGQLGNGNKNSTSTPVTVSGIGAGVLSLSAALNHTCAVVSSGGAKCWGANYNFQLGDGTNNEHTTPTDVFGLQSGIKSISAFWEFSCALTTSGAVQCWGKNDIGNLGDNSAKNSAKPVSAIGLTSGVTNIATGQEHACAVSTNGGIKCWGRNNFGQRGNGKQNGQSTPIEVSGVEDHNEQIAAGGNHSCVLDDNDTMKCWGRNTFGQLGDGTTDGRYPPQNVEGLSLSINAIDNGDNHSCALRGNGNVLCWGLNSSYQLGDNSNLNRATPVAVNLSGVKIKAISEGRRHTCALTNSAGVKCWGNNEFGQLGDGTTAQRTSIVDVVGLGSGVTAIAVGGDSSCALQNSNVVCWGLNSSGQLGNGNFTSSSVPVTVNGIGAIPTQVAISWSHACALTNLGTIYCWGQNYRGQLGNDSTEPSPLPVAVHNINNGAKQVFVGREHTCALVNSGVQCWGNNTSGQIGDGTFDYRTEPVSVKDLAQGVQKIAVGLYHACALMNSGSVKCWGYGEFGQLGSNPGWTATNALGFGNVPPPTAVPTNTATPTRPILPTNATATPTSSPTSSATATATPTHTPKSTATKTATKTPTKTLSPTPTETPIPGSTSTPTSAFPTPTETSSPTETPTETPVENATYTINLPIIARQPAPTPQPTSAPLAWRRLTGSPDILDTVMLDETDHLFVGARSSGDEANGIYRALDCSDNAIFQQVTSSMNMRDLTFLGTYGVAGTFGQGLFFSKDNGASWTRTTSIINDYVFSLLYTSATRAYAATDNKLYLSDDSGETWRLLYDGVDPSRLNELYFDATTGILWIGTYDQGLWKLLPGAPTAQSFNSGFSPQSVEINEIVFKDGTLYIGTSDGVYRGDGNADWAPFGLQGSYIVSLEVVDDTLYAGVKEQPVNGGKGKGIWLRPFNASVDWSQDASIVQDLEVNELFYKSTGNCNALLAATSQGLWAYR